MQYVEVVEAAVIQTYSLTWWARTHIHTCIQAMAEAVENAGVVLVCYSEKYKDSKNCRTGKLTHMVGIHARTHMVFIHARTPMHLLSLLPRLLYPMPPPPLTINIQPYHYHPPWTPASVWYGTREHNTINIISISSPSTNTSPHPHSRHQCHPHQHQHHIYGGYKH
jgi:hypothetical protein